MGFLIPVLMLLACLGLGGAVLRVSGVGPSLTPNAWWPWSFALGYGLLGWLVFPVGAVGWLEDWALWGLIGVGLAGMVWAPPPLPRWQRRTPSAIGALLIACLAATAGLDLTEALAPPVDADSLAYHFRLPKQFLAWGEIRFVPRAMDGAVPLLPQMTYVMALGLGGEQALTLWQFLSTWMLAALVHVTVRRHLDRTWALACTASLMTLPAVVYGAGSGQVETKIALFVAVSLFALAEARRTGDGRWAAVAGLAAGFYVGSKYLGLIFAGSVGLVLLLFVNRWRNGVVFGLAALVAGGQWYAWNFLHTGDPVFPMLYPLLGDGGTGYWSAARHDLLWQANIAPEIAMPPGPVNLLLFPFAALFGMFPEMEAGRAGFGPLPALAIPAVAWIAWRKRHRILAHPLAPVVGVAVLVFVLWFLAGSPQRVRHLLPIVPPLWIVLFLCLRRVADHPAATRPVQAAIGLTLGFQMVLAVVFAYPMADALAKRVPRDRFLPRSVSAYDVARWANANLDPRDRLAVILDRQIMYYFDIPAFFADRVNQNLVDITRPIEDAGTLLSELEALGITHIVFPSAPPDSPNFFDRVWTSLEAAGCARLVARVEAGGWTSRTMARFGGKILRQKHAFYRLVPGPRCRVEFDG